MTPDHPIEVAIRALSRLPGIGRRTASRLTFYLLSLPREEVAALTCALDDLKTRMGFCGRCEGLAEGQVCDICADHTRDAGTICVVEQPRDVFVIEQTGAYHGQYHCLHGVLSPIHGVGPQELRIESLLRRIEAGGVHEVIIATNPTHEGEATGAYLAQLLVGRGVQVTRLARGIPVGGDLEYLDGLTLSRALEGRGPLA